jgi:hypothetical protein
MSSLKTLQDGLPISGLKFGASVRSLDPKPENESLQPEKILGLDIRGQDKKQLLPLNLYLLESYCFVVC